MNNKSIEEQFEWYIKKMIETINPYNEDTNTRWASMTERLTQINKQLEQIADSLDYLVKSETEGVKNE